MARYAQYAANESGDTYTDPTNEILRTGGSASDLISQRPASNYRLLAGTVGCNWLQSDLIPGVILRARAIHFWMQLWRSPLRAPLPATCCNLFVDRDDPVAGELKR